MENNNNNINDTILSVQGLSKFYGPNQDKAMKLKNEGVHKDEIYNKTRSTVALRDISFDIGKGDIFVIIGLSGSGKSTLLRMFNMLNTPTEGSLLFEGRDISQFNKEELKEYRRKNISMVFQSFGLMSHRNVIGNIKYGLEVQGLSEKEQKEKCMELISMVGLEGLENEPIDSLSGGMKQRVGIARALSTDPDILLMDEPFSALDPLVRKDMQFELMSIQKKLGTTVIFITHDVDEAFKLGDRIAILKDGELIQVDTPEQILENPADDYVTEFIQDADKTQVVTVENAMIRPNSMVRLTDSPHYALNIMKRNGVSSAYVVGRKMEFKGIITLDDALDATKEKLSLADVLITDVMKTSPDTLLSDVMEMAVETNFPIAVVSETGALRGILSKVHVLTSML